MKNAGIFVAAAELPVKRGPRFKDLTGQRFGRLRVNSLAGMVSYAKCKSAMWSCICDCGSTHEIRSTILLRGEANSCGCLRSEVVAAKNFKHGGAGTKTFIIWQAMIRRCTNPNVPEWMNYGGRGIIVCARWRHSFENFLEDLGQRPSLKHSIDRHPDKNGNYDPLNCRWATVTEQNRNRRSNRMLTIDGDSKILTEWAEHSGISRMTISGRLKKGWDIKRAVFEPVDIHRPKNRTSDTLAARPSLL